MYTGHCIGQILLLCLNYVVAASLLGQSSQGPWSVRVKQKILFRPKGKGIKNRGEVGGILVNSRYIVKCADIKSDDR